MKYMTFNSSCSYCGLANLLSFYGVDTLDRKIALQMKLPYLFAFQDGCYLSGPMLQGAKWFNLYLRPLGFVFSECQWGREEACAHLQASCPAMLGLRISPERKHAVIFTGMENNKFQFINNKWQNSSEPETLSLTEKDLLARLDESIIIGHLEYAAPASVDFRPYLEDSFRVLQRLQKEINAFCAQEQTAVSLRAARNELFRPLLLDGVTMLELLGETAEPLKEIQTQFLRAVRENRPAVLAEVLDGPRLNAAIDEYGNLIVKHMETIQDNI